MMTTGIVKHPNAAAISRLLNPATVAIVGASPTPGSLGNSALRNLTRSHFSGALHLVNPRRSEIDGLPCKKSIEELPHGVDCAVLAIPRAGVLDAVRSCANKGVGGVIIFSAGFAEIGAAGKADQEEISAIAHAAHMVVEGPNCPGLVNYVRGIPLTFIDTPANRLDKSRALAVVSQSGAMTAVVGVALNAREIGLSYSISTGNEADTGVEDFVDYLLGDPNTQAIVLVVEQFRDPQRFLALARRSRQIGKPIILLHPGRSAAARESAGTHTGAIVGDDAVMRLKVTQAGVALVDTLEELLDLSELFIRCGAAPRAGAAVVTESGAFRALTLDFCEVLGLPLPALQTKTFDALRVALPDFVPPTNPLDLTAQALVQPELYRNAITPLLQEEQFGSVVIVNILTNDATSRLKLVPIINALRDLKPTKPVILAGLDEGAEVSPEFIAELRGLGVPFFPTTERAYRALARFTAYGQPLPVPHSDLAVDAGQLTPGVVPEYESKKILARLGIPTPAGGLARTSDEAQTIATRIGFPVVLKAQSAGLSHKSDAGGVALNITDSAALAEAWTTMCASVESFYPGLVLNGILVETMGKRGLELLVGGRNDPLWGSVLLIGLGGVLAEALGDVRLIPPDLTEDAIATELGKLKGAALLTGFRGSPPVDIPAAAAIVARVGALLQARSDIVEIDINPVIVYPSAAGAVALDALMVVDHPPSWN